MMPIPAAYTHWTDPVSPHGKPNRPASAMPSMRADRAAGWCPAWCASGRKRIDRTAACLGGRCSRPPPRWRRTARPSPASFSRNLGLAGAQVRKQPGFDQAFLANGADRAAGSIWRPGALAETLDRIAQHGEHGFLKARSPKRCAASRPRQGLLEQADLRHITAQWRQPVRQEYEPFGVTVMPP